jgi:hypothetical protein
MNGWIMLVSGPDLAPNQSLRRRLIAVTADDSDEAFEAARVTVPGGLPQSIGPLTEDAVTDLRVTPGKGRVLNTF